MQQRGDDRSQLGYHWSLSVGWLVSRLGFSSGFLFGVFSAVGFSMGFLVGVWVSPSGFLGGWFLVSVWVSRLGFSSASLVGWFLDGVSLHVVWVSLRRLGFSSAFGFLVGLVGSRWGFSRRLGFSAGFLVGVWVSRQGLVSRQVVSFSASRRVSRRLGGFLAAGFSFSRRVSQSFPVSAVFLLSGFILSLDGFGFLSLGFSLVGGYSLSRRFFLSGW